MNFDFVLYEGYNELNAFLVFFAGFACLVAFIWLFIRILTDMDYHIHDHKNAAAHLPKAKVFLKYLALLTACATVVGGFVFAINLPQNPYDSDATHANLQKAITETYGLELTKDEVAVLAPLMDMMGYNEIYYNSRQENKLELYGIITTLNQDKEIIKVQLAEVEDSYRLVYADGDPSSLHELEKASK